MVKEKVKAKVKAAATSVRKKVAAKPAENKAAAKPAPGKPAAKATTESPATAKVTEDPRTRTKPHGEKVAEAAYYKAQKRNFEPGFDLQDWLEAEHEIGEHADH